MALTKEERELLQSAAEHAAANNALLQEHSNQIQSLFKITARHTVQITQVTTKQEMCQQQNAPGNKSERKSVWVAIVGVVVAIILGVINLFK